MTEPKKSNNPFINLAREAAQKKFANPNALKSDPGKFTLTNKSMINRPAKKTTGRGG
jgi:hypothetical protein